MREQPTARTVVDGDIPGGLNVFLQDQITVTGPDASTTVDITENEIVPVGVGDEITVAANIDNNASTAIRNVDSCSGGSGTSFNLVLGGLAVDGPIRGPSECIEDSDAWSGWNTETAFATFTAPESVGNSQFELWVEGTNSEVRLTPIYGITLGVGEMVEPPEEPPSDDPDDGDDGGDGGDGGGDGGDDDSDFRELTLDDLALDCEVGRTDVPSGGAFTVDATVEPKIGIDSFYRVDVGLNLNGTRVETTELTISPNRPTTATFTVAPEDGRYNPVVVVENLIG